MEEDEDQSYTQVSHHADVVFTVNKQQGRMRQVNQESQGTQASSEVDVEASPLHFSMSGTRTTTSVPNVRHLDKQEGTTAPGWQPHDLLSHTAPVTESHVHRQSGLAPHAQLPATDNPLTALPPHLLPLPITSQSTLECTVVIRNFAGEPPITIEDITALLSRYDVGIKPSRYAGDEGGGCYLEFCNEAMAAEAHVLLNGHVVTSRSEGGPHRVLFADHLCTKGLYGREYQEKAAPPRVMLVHDKHRTRKARMEAALDVICTEEGISWRQVAARWSKLSLIFGYSLQTPIVSTSAFDAVADALWPDRHPPARPGGFGYLHYAVRDDLETIDVQEFHTQFSPNNPLRSEYEMKVWQQYEVARQDVIQRGVSTDAREQQLAALKELVDRCVLVWFSMWGLRAMLRYFHNDIAVFLVDETVGEGEWPWRFPLSAPGPPKTSDEAIFLRRWRSDGKDNFQPYKIWGRTRFYAIDVPPLARILHAVDFKEAGERRAAQTESDMEDN